MIIDFVLGIVALAAVWVSAKRWSVAYLARYGKRPANAWMFSRVDDPDLERGRLVLLAILVVAVLIAIAILSRSYGTSPT